MSLRCHDFFQLRHWTCSQKRIVKCLIRSKFLKSWIGCSNCGSRCNITADCSSSDSFSFKCSHRQCSKKFSIRTMSPAYNTKFTLLQWLLVIWCFSNKMSDAFTADFSQVSIYTIRRWFKRFRLCISAHLTSNPIILGDNYIVEIDESCFSGKPKHNRGRMLGAQQRWVFGLIERVSRRFVMIEVPNRTSATLIPLIQRYARVGATIQNLVFFFLSILIFIYLFWN